MNGYPHPPGRRPPPAADALREMARTIYDLREETLSHTAELISVYAQLQRRLSAARSGPWPTTSERALPAHLRRATDLHQRLTLTAHELVAAVDAWELMCALVDAYGPDNHRRHQQ